MPAAPTRRVTMLAWTKERTRFTEASGASAWRRPRGSGGSRTVARYCSAGVTTGSAWWRPNQASRSRSSGGLSMPSGCTSPLSTCAAKLLADAKRLLEERHRVAHSVMICELDPCSRIYEAWHLRRDAGLRVTRTPTRSSSTDATASQPSW